jgi:hypothetical protein
MIKAASLRLMCLVGFSMAVVLSAHVYADKPLEPANNSQFTLELGDGSSIICTPALDALPITTSFADIKIPLQRVESMTCTAATNLVTLILMNGDRLQGTCDLDSLTVASLLGDLKIPMRSVVSLVTTLKRAPVFEDSPAKRSACINNIRQLDAGKEQWAMATNQRSGAVVNEAGVNAYIKGNRTPICPAGGAYTYNTIGKTPECNVPGHAMR